MDDQQQEQQAADELEQRRLAREGSINAEQENGGGEIGEEDDGQLFVFEQGRKVTLGTLISRGTPTEHAFVFTGKRLKGSGGLPALDDDVFFIVRGRLAKASVVPSRDDDENVTKAVIENHVAPKVIVNALTDEGVSLMRTLIDKATSAEAS